MSALKRGPGSIPAIRNKLKANRTRHWTKGLLRFSIIVIVSKTHRKIKNPKMASHHCNTIEGTQKLGDTGMLLVFASKAIKQVRSKFWTLFLFLVRFSRERRRRRRFGVWGTRLGWQQSKISFSLFFIFLSFLKLGPLDVVVGLLKLLSKQNNFDSFLFYFLLHLIMVEPVLPFFLYTLLLLTSLITNSNFYLLYYICYNYNNSCIYRKN